MGCTQSKVENEESVLRCKQRKMFMKEAVTARNAFTAAHFSYITLLKNTGAALNDYGQGETTDVRVPGGVAPNPQILDPLPKPPPPPFEYESGNMFLEGPPINRSVSMPTIALQNAVEAAKIKVRESSPPPRREAPPIVEEEDEGEEAEREEGEHDVVQPPPAPPPPPRDNQAPPPPPPPSTGTWDFFDNILDYSSNHPPSGAAEEQPVLVPQIKQVKEEKSATAASVSAGDDHEEEVEQEDHDSHRERPTEHRERPAVHSRSHSNNKVVVHPSSSKGEVPLPISSDHGKGGGSGRKDLLQVLQDLDDHFLKASESGLEVFKMLEAHRLHYHSNFADNNGLIDADRVKRVITWNRSFTSYASEDENKKEEKETHASILDKLLAWEKKLYDEVKAGELMKIEYQKKSAILNRQKKSGKNSEALEKTKAAVKYLHTRYMVDFQAMDSTSSEIRRLRDKELYPKLVDLVSGLANMWRKMHENHCRQQDIVADLRGLEVSNAPEETTKHHHERTLQLYSVVNDWHQQSSKLLQYQKDYINHLNNWLRLNLVPIESNLKERSSSPPQTANPPIHGLLQAWHNQLDKVPEQGLVEGLKSFAAIIQRIATTQEDEMKQKLRYEEAKAEYERKKKAFSEWQRKYIDRNMPIDQASEQPEGNNKDPMIDRQNQIQILKSKVEDEESKYVKACKYTRGMSLNTLKTGLPNVFYTISEFARVCMVVYTTLDELKSNPAPLQNGE